MPTHKQERRLQQKEENLDRKTENIEKKEDIISTKMAQLRNPATKWPLSKRARWNFWSGSPLYRRRGQGLSDRPTGNRGYPSLP